jgi:hypothetical protein
MGLGSGVVASAVASAGGAMGLVSGVVASAGGAMGLVSGVVASAVASVVVGVAVRVDGATLWRTGRWMLIESPSERTTNHCLEVWWSWPWRERRWRPRWQRVLPRGLSRRMLCGWPRQAHEASVEDGS